ncbi:Hypothetical protein FKW44_016116, partial [Caligus rogercresseyi]
HWVSDWKRILWRESPTGLVESGWEWVVFYLLELDPFSKSLVFKVFYIAPQHHF